jgi:hypothetical protein
LSLPRNFNLMSCTNPQGMVATFQFISALHVYPSHAVQLNIQCRESEIACLFKMYALKCLFKRGKFSRSRNYVIMASSWMSTHILSFYCTSHWKFSSFLMYSQVDNLNMWGVKIIFNQNFLKFLK